MSSSTIGVEITRSFAQWRNPCSRRHTNVRRMRPRGPRICWRTMTDDVPYRFEPDANVADLVDQFASLEPGTETADTVTVAGRLMLRRVQGKLAFGTLQDSDRPHPAVRAGRHHAGLRAIHRPDRSATGSA